METSTPLHSIEDFRTAYENGERLRGFRSACGFVTATWGLACPKCGQRDLAEVDLPTTGTLVASTVQNVPGDEFLNEAPYAYVVVELEGGGRITGWIEGIKSEDELRVGTPVRWTPSYKPGIRFALGKPSSSPPS